MSGEDYSAEISIRNTIKQETKVLYEITIEVSFNRIIPLNPHSNPLPLTQAGPYSWKCFHRYSDFADLHEKLVNERGLKKDLLPKKKVKRMHLIMAEQCIALHQKTNSVSTSVR